MFWTITMLLVLAVVLVQIPIIYKENNSIKKEFLLEHEIIKFSNSKFVSLSKISGYENNVYHFNKNEVNDILQTYMISTKGKRMYFSSHLNDVSKSGTIVQIKIYDNYKTCVQILNVTMKNDSDMISMMQLPKETSFVNVALLSKVQQVNEMKKLYDDKFKKQMPVLYRQSIVFLVSLAPISYFLLAILTGDRLYKYMIAETVWLGVLIIFTFGLLNFLLSLLMIKIKTKKEVKKYE